MKSIIEKFLNRISLDERIEDGIFNIENNDHMDIFQEYLEKYGVKKEECISTRNKVLEGKYPERQAYNADGILVTFPTPDYKKKAIERGTHFEKDPTKSEPNIKFDQEKTSEEPSQEEPSQEEPSQEEPSQEEPNVIDVVAPVNIVAPGELKRREEEEVDQAKEEYVEDLLKNESYKKDYYSIEEAMSLNFKRNGLDWYNESGRYIGTQKFNEALNKIIII